MRLWNTKSERFADFAMAEIEMLLRKVDDDPHVESVDDLTRRRAVDAVLDKVDEPVNTESDLLWNIERENRFWSKYRRLAGVSAITAAAAMVVIGLASVFVLAPNGPELETESTSPNPAKSSARVLLASSNCGTPTDRLITGREVEEKESISVEDGQVVLGLAARAKIKLESDTRVRFDKLRSSKFDIFLEKGELFASVEPGDGQPDFIVSTPYGRAVMTGTIFSVRVSNEQVDVMVYRGSVRVEDSGVPSYSVRASQTARMGNTETIPLTQANENAALDTTRTLDLLSNSASTVLEVRSTPPGASVLIDGEVLGQTPVVAAARSGYRELELTLPGYASVREKLELSRGDTITRVFELTSDSVDIPNEDVPKTQEKQKRSKARAAPGPNASEMLVQAQSLRGGRDWSGAAKAYKQIIRTFQASPEARTARVPLGVIQLNHLNQPARALKNFNAYLSTSANGALAPEAAYGRAAALRALGRTTQETHALENFINNYPSSLRVTEAKRRLSDLESR
ncbi:MAG: PEGA domain-containing protein [Proteobacteria bacterium]|nr:PEGA domain-containing protein [Pseudomonadota bacterium]